MPPTRVAVIGSTGSIGTQTIEVCEATPDQHRVVSLAAHSSVDALIDQARRLRPEVVALGRTDADLVDRLRGGVPEGTAVVSGPDGFVEAAGAGDVVINGVVGFAGLRVTLATLEAGRRLGLANKESLIAGGPVVRRAMLRGGGEIVPVDSEHCAIHQCLGAARAGVAAGAPDPTARLVLTASGGPFRGRSAESLASVTVDDALDHPTWSMGPKITVDSSTLMNKGLEVIEACELFGVTADRVDVVVHPQSIVHSMVELTDGAVLAQMSRPDMRQCIGYALAHPGRLGVAFGPIDWSAGLTLTFEPPDLDTFRCLGLAYEAARLGGSAPATLNAANEVSVDAFLRGLISWPQIADVNETVLERSDVEDLSDADHVEAVDRRARDLARTLVGAR